MKQFLTLTFLENAWTCSEYTLDYEFQHNTGAAVSWMACTHVPNTTAFYMSDRCARFTKLQWRIVSSSYPRRWGGRSLVGLTWTGKGVKLIMYRISMLWKPSCSKFIDTARYTELKFYEYTVFAFSTSSYLHGFIHPSLFIKRII